MLAADGSPLVAGTWPASTMATKTIRIQVLRAFLIGGKPQPVGSEIDVDVALAAELFHSGKAQRAPEPAPAAKPAAKKE